MTRLRFPPLLFLTIVGLAGACALIMFVGTGLMLLAPQMLTMDNSTPSGRATPVNTAVAVVQLPTATATPRLATAFAATGTPTPTTPAPDTASTLTSTPSPREESGCPAPEAWEVHHVQPGETLFAYVLGAIDLGFDVTTHDLRTANCLTTDLLQVGQVLYLPPGAAENAPPSEPVVMSANVPAGSPRTPACVPHCTISIRPGWRAEQIAAVIDSTPVGFWGADFLAAISASAAPPPYEFLATKPPGASLEGYLYPGTYELTNETTAEGFRDMLLAAFAAHYSPDMAAAARAHGLTFYQALTLASIIQRESWAYEEQVLISSVFHNRLRAGDKLGSTVTTQYALGGPGNWWPRVTGGLINTPSPYNTNLNPGLPPTPIDSPGMNAIRAALNPASTDYYFFTGNCQGPGNLYARTFEEHLANVNLCG